MREIKFRGKVADEPDEWVYGYLCSKNTIYQEKEHEDTKCCGVGTFKVSEETISQYIGFKNEDGVEIYEGDIIENNWREKFVIKYIKSAFYVCAKGLYDYNKIRSICNVKHGVVIRKYLG